jgi:mRNA interferase YafQ
MANKRATHPRALGYTRDFTKDWERMTRTGRYDMPLLKQVMLELVGNDGPLGPESRDHPLKGNWR